MKIRPATISDLDALVSLNSHVLSLHAAAMPSLFRADPPAAEVAEAFQKILEDPNAIVLVAETTMPCGHICAQVHDRAQSWARPALRYCNIAHIVVHPDARKQGVARGLVDAAVLEAEKRGCTRIELDVWSFNHAAREAFKHLGFETFNERMELTRPAQPPKTR